MNQAAVERLVERVRGGASSSEVIAALDGWTLEPAEKALERLASYAVPLSRRLGKGELVTTVSAPEVRLDPRAWNGLWSVLVHVVRNALDHGIETPDVRAAHGKGQPRLRFSAREEGGRLFVEIADDGQGIDWKRVAEKAAARGMPAATQKDLEAALLDPGFTTRDEITTISGRGVGMSAVAEEVKRLGGTMEVMTTPQLGTAWQFSLPMAA